MTNPALDLDRQLTAAIERLAGLDLHDLLARARAELRVAAGPTARPDGYPRQTPGAAPNTTPLLVPVDPTTGQPLNEPGHDTTTEAAALTRRHQDPQTRRALAAIGHLVEANKRIDHALNLLEQNARDRDGHRLTDPAPGCAVITAADPNAWEPATHYITAWADGTATTGRADLTNPAAVGAHVHVSRWTYDHVARHNRPPTNTEIRDHLAGRRIRTKR